MVKSCKVLNGILNKMVWKLLNLKVWIMRGLKVEILLFGILWLLVDFFKSFDGGFMKCWM